MADLRSLVSFSEQRRDVLPTEMDKRRRFWLLTVPGSHTPAKVGRLIFVHFVTTRASLLEQDS